MVKISRNTQQIFASQAGSRQITAFGTAKTETPEFTTDISQIQNTNFLQGWLSALLPDKSPWEEDMNAVFYAITSQLAYLFQQGIPEYDEGTTYYIGSLVKNIDNQGNITIYKSIINENIGNSLTDTNYWAIFQSDGSQALATYEIGLPQPTFSNNLLANEIWLEGQEVSRTEYANLFALWGTAWGEGDGSTTFNLPNCLDKVFWGASSFGYIEAGLPNITGTLDKVYANNNSTGTGAFSLIYSNQNTREWGNGCSVYTLNFNAGMANGIYGNSPTVQPPAIKCRVKTRYQ